MDEFDKQRNEIIELKEKLRNKFKSQGLSDDKVEINILRLEIDFLWHSYINNHPKNDWDSKQKVDFYIKSLRMYLDDNDSPSF